VLWRKRRQVLLVLTAPLISMVFLVLAGYAPSREGIGMMAAQSFTCSIKPQARRHTGISLYAAGMTPWNGLRFKGNGVFPTGADGRGTDPVIDLTESQQFSSASHGRHHPTLKRSRFVSQRKIELHPVGRKRNGRQRARIQHQSIRVPQWRRGLHARRFARRRQGLCMHAFSNRADLLRNSNPLPITSRWYLPPI
jgi:hypothetical protein